MTWSLIFVFLGGHHVTYDIHALKVPVFLKQLLEV